MSGMMISGAKTFDEKCNLRVKLDELLKENQALRKQCPKEKRAHYHEGKETTLCRVVKKRIHPIYASVVRCNQTTSAAIVAFWTSGRNGIHTYASASLTQALPEPSPGGPRQCFHGPAGLSRALGPSCDYHHSNSR